jgi:hypothetical protein
MPDINQPGDVAGQVDVPGVANPQTGARAMALKLALVDHLTQRSRVEQPA